MARSFREVVESIVFAGMKPTTPGSAPPPRQSAFRARLDRLLAGGAQSDPLYLSRRTPAQRIGKAAIIAVPCLIAFLPIGLALNRHYTKKIEVPKLDMSPAEIAAKMLPNMDNVKLDTNRDVDVMEVHIDRSQGVALMGTVMNNTAHPIQTAEIVFDLTDSSGSQLGGVSERVENLAPQVRQKFRLPIDQSTASFVLVREVRTR